MSSTDDQLDSDVEALYAEYRPEAIYTQAQLNELSKQIKLEDSKNETL
jgi:hypothetical protein